MHILKDSEGTMNLQKLENLLAVLSSEGRLKILFSFKKKRRYCRELAAELGYSQAHVSKVLIDFKRVGLIVPVFQKGRKVVYELSDLGKNIVKCFINISEK